MEDKNPIQVAGRLFEALEYLAEHGQCGLMEVANALELNKSTAHRVLSSLQYMGYVRQNVSDGKYECTFKLVGLSDRILRRVDAITAARPHLQALMEATGETVHMVQREGTEAVYIDKEESSHNSIQMVSRLGNRIPLYCSGVGKAMAAMMPPAELEEMWNSSRIVRLTPYTITDYSDFCETLREIRQKGYSLDNEENETGVRCIAAALDPLPGEPVKYAFSISAPVYRMDNDRIRTLAVQILQTKKDIMKDLYN